MKRISFSDRLSLLLLFSCGTPVPDQRTKPVFLKGPNVILW